MNPTVKIIAPSGILDSTQDQEFREAIDNALHEGAEILLVDLKDVTFIDSSGLGTLVVGLKKVRSYHRKMYVCSINDQVRMLFELTSMDHVFDLMADQDEFETRILGQAGVTSEA